MKKLEIVLDLDNTLICSVEMEDIHKIKKELNGKNDINLLKKKEHKHIHECEQLLDYKDWDEYYRIFSRPHLQDFLDYLFDNFIVTVWSAADASYVFWIVENFILIKPNRHLKAIFFRKDCDISSSIYDKDSPKDLRLLNNEYSHYGYLPCRTLIIDDHPEVYRANKNNCIRADFFDVAKKSAQSDDFLIRSIKILEKLRKIKTTCAH